MTDSALNQRSDNRLRQAARARLSGMGALAPGYAHDVRWSQPDIPEDIMAEEAERANRRSERQHILHVVASLGITGADNAIEASKKLIAFINGEDA